MNAGLGSVVTRRILFILFLLTPLLMIGVEYFYLIQSKDAALIHAQEDAEIIQQEAEKSLKAAGPNSSPLVYYRQAANAVAHEADEIRSQNKACDWQRDTRIIQIFDAFGAPLREPSDKGIIEYPGSSIPGKSKSVLIPFKNKFGRLQSVSFDINDGAAPCLVSGTAIGVVIPFTGGSFAAMRLVAFDWKGYLGLLFYAYCALGGFWLLAELVAWQFNAALNRRVSRISTALKAVEQNDFSARVPVDGSRELATLGRDINAMIDRVGLAHQYFSDLNGFVAHNLRAPLNIARTLVEDLARTGGYNTSVLLPELDRQLADLERRCLQLLDKAKLETTGPTRSDPTDLAIVLAKQVDDIFFYLAQEKELEIRLETEPAFVAMPTDMQEMIIDNLLQNAIKFGDQGTTIDVVLTKHEGFANLSITNRGPSVSPTDFGKILERGFTTDGHGLGLYAVRTAVTLHRGNVTPLPQEGGFRILITLPLTRK